MPDPSTFVPHLVHVAAVLYLVCFLFRDQIALRIFAIAGDFIYAIYYFGVAETPLWEAMFWSSMNILINITMITLLLRDKRMHRLSDDEMNLYQNLRGLNPGQFRRLMKAGNWKRTAESSILTREGDVLDTLFYVMDGSVEVEKAGRTFNIEPAVFIGELAYLRNKPATATVHVGKGALLVAWKHADLNRLTMKEESLRNVLALLLNADLAEKVARA